MLLGGKAPTWSAPRIGSGFWERVGLLKEVEMPKKGSTPEQIIGLLRQAEVELAQGRTVGEICRRLGVSDARYYRWRAEYGGLKVGQARRLKGSGHCPAPSGSI
jgi:hypothetical protein